MTDDPQKDMWSDWLLRRRHPVDEAVANDWMKRVHELRDRVLDGANMKAGDTVLDVGAGDGLIAFGALDRVGPRGRVIFSDISRPLLDECQRIARDLGVEDRCEFINASAGDLAGIADESVDIVTTRSVLIYLKDKESSFRAFYRVLRPGGRISLFEPVGRITADVFIALQQREAVEPSEISGLEERLGSYLSAFQPAGEDPMSDFDERDLLRHCIAAGFDDVHLKLEVDVTHGDPMSWEAWASVAPNPRLPSLAEAMEHVLSIDERAAYERVHRPIIEAGANRVVMCHAWLTATKAE